MVTACLLQLDTYGIIFFPVWGTQIFEDWCKPGARSLKNGPGVYLERSRAEWDALGHSRVVLWKRKIWPKWRRSECVSRCRRSTWKLRASLQVIFGISAAISCYSNWSCCDPQRTISEFYCYIIFLVWDLVSVEAPVHNCDITDMIVSNRRQLEKEPFRDSPALLVL